MVQVGGFVFQYILIKSIIRARYKTRHRHTRQARQDKTLIRQTHKTDKTKQDKTHKPKDTRQDKTHKARQDDKTDKTRQDTQGKTR